MDQTPPPTPQTPQTPPRTPARKPKHLDLKKDRGLTIEWDDGHTSYYSIAYLRKWSPSADAKELRDELAKNPLAILPSSAVSGQPLTAVNAELIGNYAIKIVFSDGHDTGIYSWDYLEEIEQRPHPDMAPPSDKSKGEPTSD